MRRTAQSRSVEFNPSPVYPALPCSRPYHANVFLIREKLCDPDNTKRHWNCSCIGESKSAVRKHGGEAAIHCRMDSVPVAFSRTDPCPRGRSGVLQAICAGCAGAGARGSRQSALWRGIAGRALVDRVCGSLRVVSCGFAGHCCRGTRCAHAISARLHGSMNPRCHRRPRKKGGRGRPFVALRKMPYWQM